MYLDDVYQAWHWESDAGSMEAFRRFFRHARFKKGSSTTVQNSYQPTKGEIELTQASADYAKKVAPNAYYLNDVARKLLQDSLGTVQVDFNRMNNDAQGRLSSALGAMGNLVGGNDAVTRTANGTLGQLAGQSGQLARENAGLLGSLAGGYRTATDAANGALGRAGGAIGQAAQTANGKLDWAGRAGLGAAGAANGMLESLANGVIPTAYQKNMEGSIR